MRDAASAAAMSDPENNRWFRRRWVEVGTPEVMTLPAVPQARARLSDDGLHLLGRELLAARRRERASKEAVR